MAKDSNDLLIAWLNDAYAMEKALIPILENHAKDAQNYPQIQSRIEQHVEETRRHADMVEECVERLGSSTSAVKTGLGSLFGALQSVSTGMAQDELIKNGLADFAAENFEIASYKALIAAAQAFGYQDIAQVCQQILRDEQEMASWLFEQLPVLVHETLRQVEMQ